MSRKLVAFLWFAVAVLIAARSGIVVAQAGDPVEADIADPEPAAIPAEHSRKIAVTEIAFQGFLTDAGGNPIDGTVSLTLKLWDAPTSGTMLWSEKQTGVAVTEGVFSIALGSVTSLNAADFTGSPLFLGVSVNGEAELPRTKLLAAPFAIRAAEADHALSADTASDGMWTPTGDDIYRGTGNVGIGQPPHPEFKLDVLGDGRVTNLLSIEATVPGAVPKLSFHNGHNNHSGVLFKGNGSNGNRSIALRMDQGPVSAFAIAESNYNPDPDLMTGWTDLLTVRSNGNVGIGTANPDRKLVVAGPTEVQDNLLVVPSGPGATPILDFHGGQGNKSGVLLRGNGSNGNRSMALRLNQGPTSTLTVTSSNFNPDPDLETGWMDLVTFQSDGNVGIGTAAPAAALHVNGTTRTEVLEITGADLVEYFHAESHVTPGMLLVIDETRPGRLRVSSEPYDHRVAGIVSGAGGLSAGIHLGRGSPVDGTIPVAMTGRVYVMCTTENGPISPGDLLTTSATPGHAMLANDVALRPGATIGKAMTSLNEGQEGLVLALVSLQ